MITNEDVFRRWKRLNDEVIPLSEAIDPSSEKLPLPELIEMTKEEIDRMMPCMKSHPLLTLEDIINFQSLSLKCTSANLLQEVDVK